MNTLVVALFAGVLAVASSHVIPYTGAISHDIIAPLSSGTTLQGPSTRTVVEGPDGSKIVADAPGGVVATNTNHVVKTTLIEPLVANVVPAVPVVAHQESVVVDAQPTPVIAARVSEVKHVVAAHPLVAGAPVVAAPVVAAAPVVEARVAATVVAAPVVTTQVGTKTSVVSTSLDQVHPSPAVAVKAVPTIVETHVEPAVEAVPVVEVKSAPASVERHAVASAAELRSAPVVAHTASFVAHPAQIIAHQAHFVENYAAPIVAARTIAVHPAPAVAIHSAPVVAVRAGPTLVATKTVLAHSAPLVGSPVIAHAAPVVAHAAPVHGVIAQGPALVGRTLVASPLTASGYPLLAPGSGIEGQYVPDNIEKLYDDGTYKGELYDNHH